MINWMLNFQGVSALHIAVNERNTAMVEYLLSHPDIDPGDTHLHAIRDNQLRIAVLILNKLNELTPGLEFAGVTHSPDFPDDTTPLAVAAQCGHFEIIDMLRFRRHILQKPHPPSCNCDEICKYNTAIYWAVLRQHLQIYKFQSNRERPIKNTTIE